MHFFPFRLLFLSFSLCLDLSSLFSSLLFFHFRTFSFSFELHSLHEWYISRRELFMSCGPGKSYSWRKKGLFSFQRRGWLTARASGWSLFPQEKGQRIESWKVRRREERGEWRRETERGRKLFCASGLLEIFFTSCFSETPFTGVKKLCN